MHKTKGWKGRLGQLLEQAAEAHRAALQVFTREQFRQQWTVTQNNLARVYFLLQNWLGAAQSYANVLSLYPDYEEAYLRASALYHDKFFKFQEAFALNQQWVARHPNDISALADLAERYFTIGRFIEFGQWIYKVLMSPEVSVTQRIALRAIEIANLLVIGNSNEVPAKLNSLLVEVGSQPLTFKVARLFEGTRYFINQDVKLSQYRTWLGELFDALAGKDRDTILKALQEAQAKFKE